MDGLWPSLARRFRVWTGMMVPDAMRATALQVLGQMAAELELTPTELLHRLDHDRDVRQALLDAIGLGTTWFYREIAGINALVEQLARITPRGQRVTLWSAGCSSGEEPYTIAMALAEAGLGGHILATDLNRRALRRGFDGIYSDRSVERLPAGWRSRYIEPHGPKTVRVAEHIRRMVTFELHNFRSEQRPPTGWGHFDAVICRNVLIYFERQDALRLIERLVGACQRGGYLLLSAVERPLYWMSDLATDSDAAELIQVGTSASSKSHRDPRAPAATDSGRLRVRPGASHERSAATARATSTTAHTATSARVVADLLARADAAERTGALSDALLLLDEATTYDPLSAPAHLARGLLYKRLGRTEDAVAAYRSACFLAPQTWMAPYQLALCLEELHDAKGAESGYRHALSVLDGGGGSGLLCLREASEALAATVADVCRKRLELVRAPGADDLRSTEERAARVRKGE